MIGQTPSEIWAEIERAFASSPAAKKLLSIRKRPYAFEALLSGDPVKIQAVLDYDRAERALWDQTMEDLSGGLR